MSSTMVISDAALLRHAFQVRKRLQLEFLGSLSKLLREFDIKLEDRLLGTLLLASPDELAVDLPIGLHAISTLTTRKGVGNKRVPGKRRGSGVKGPQPPGGGKQKRGVKGPQPPGGGKLRKGVKGPQPPGGGKLSL